MPSVRPTVATASAPRRATKNTSTMANSDSIDHFEHHRHGEQQHGAADAAFGEILVRAEDGVADVAQEACEARAGVRETWGSSEGLILAQGITGRRGRRPADQGSAHLGVTSNSTDLASFTAGFWRSSRQHRLGNGGVGGDHGHGFERLAGPARVRRGGRGRSWRC